MKIFIGNTISKLCDEMVFDEVWAKRYKSTMFFMRLLDLRVCQRGGATQKNLFTCISGMLYNQQFSAFMNVCIGVYTNGDSRARIQNSCVIRCHLSWYWNIAGFTKWLYNSLTWLKMPITPNQFIGTFCLGSERFSPYTNQSIQSTLAWKWDSVVDYYMILHITQYVIVMRCNKKCCFWISGDWVICFEHQIIVAFPVFIIFDD